MKTVEIGAWKVSLGMAAIREFVRGRHFEAVVSLVFCDRQTGLLTNWRPSIGCRSFRVFAGVSVGSHSVVYPCEGDSRDLTEASA